jgi:hypothetical protein
MSKGIIEGGEFIDYRDPKKTFRTKDPVEWDKHLKETNAVVSGTGLCAICSQSVQFENIKYGTKPVCDSCKGSLVNQ